MGAWAERRGEIAQSEKLKSRPEGAGEALQADANAKALGGEQAKALEKPAEYLPKAECDVDRIWAKDSPPAPSLPLSDFLEVLERARLITYHFIPSHKRLAKGFRFASSASGGASPG